VGQLLADLVDQIGPHPEAGQVLRHLGQEALDEGIDRGGHAQHAATGQVQVAGVELAQPLGAQADLHPRAQGPGEGGGRHLQTGPRPTPLLERPAQRRRELLPLPRRARLTHSFEKGASESEGGHGDHPPGT
jgi:hypothetical protein